MPGGSVLRRYAWRPMSRASRSGRDRWGTIVLAACVIAAPWVWFLVRGAGGPLDAVAVALPAIGVAALIALGMVAAVRRRLLPLLAGLSIFAACAVATVGPRMPRHDPAPDPAIRIASANVYDANPSLEAAAIALLSRNVDVLVTVEVRPRVWKPLIFDPQLHEVKYDGELLVSSRYPLTPLPPNGLPRSQVFRVKVDAPDAPFTLYVTHADNPFHGSTSLSDQRTFVEAVAASAAAEPRPVVVIGDFNMSDRSENYRIMDSAFVDAMREHNVPGSTYFGGLWPLLLVRIDHAFVSPGWCADDGSTFTVPGSDHRGIQVTVGPCPGTG